MGRLNETSVLTAIVDSGGPKVGVVASGVDGKVIRVLGFRLNSERGACVSFFEQDPSGKNRNQKGESLSGRIFVPARGKAEAKPTSLGWFGTTPEAKLMYETDGQVAGMIRYTLTNP